MSNHELFDALVPLLVDEVLEKLSRLETDSPLCRLKFWYYDTCAPSCYYLAEGLTEVQRSQLLTDQGRNALYEIWDGGSGNVEFDLGGQPDSPTHSLLARVYSLMSSDDLDEMGQGHEGRRALVQKVALQLNAMDLSTKYSVTDDFVAYAQNGTDYGCDTYEDICASVPESKLELLRSRKLMGPGERYDERPGYKYGSDPTPAQLAVVETIAQVQKRSPQEQIEYWIGQLDQMAGGEECDMKQFKVLASFPLRKLLELGNDAVLPLVRLANKWADQPEWNQEDSSGGLTPMHDVIISALLEIQKMRYGNREIELLLRDSLEKAWRSNAHRSLWGMLPVHFATTLHKFFDGYPEPEMEGNALVHPEQFLNVKLH